MSRLGWGKITRAHVVESLCRYDENPGLYTRAKHTFLLHDGKQYPAKAIRGIAYEVCFGKKISQKEFTGGKETARFFQRLGFEIVVDGTVSPGSPPAPKSPTELKRSRKLNPAAQKNALHSLLQKRFGIVVTEKRFDWLQVPRVADFDDTYTRIYESLRQDRGHQHFARVGHRPRIDFYVESLNLVIEYDENQHFSHARYLTLECYPSDLTVGFSIEEWMDTCSRINAADNHPVNRDETRAFYDAVRDIEVSRHGMHLLRIRHGAVDWEADDAGERLTNLLRPYVKDGTVERMNPSLAPGDQRETG